MRFSSSSRQFLVAATTADGTMSYSYRAPYRGRNSGQRGFSDRPNSFRNDFVSGDSHIRSVGNSNYAYRQVDGMNFPNFAGQHQHFPHTHYLPQQLNPPFRQQPPFCHPQTFQQQQQPNYPYFRQQPPAFRQQLPPFRQQPPPFRQPNYKPPDYRNWQYALSQPPSQCERFVILSYNILADYLALKHRRELYFHIPPYVLDWEWRKKKILFELGLWSPDIMCLQEVDRFTDLEEELKNHGYSGIWKMRTGIAVDGCAVFWRTARFRLVHEESIEYNKHELRDNVAQICVLESRSQNSADIRSDSLPQSSDGANQVVICNTHVLYNPRRGEIKLGQVRVLLDRAHAVSKLWNDSPVIICGDFNCTPKSPLYNFISEQKLDLTGRPRDQISGQCSAQIYTSRLYTPNPRQVSFIAPTPDNSNLKQNDCIPDNHNQSTPNMDVENGPVTGNSYRFQSAAGMSTGALRSGSVVDYKEEKTTISNESLRQIQNEVIDDCKNKVSSSFHVLVDLGNAEVQDFDQLATSSNAVVVENGHGDQTCGSTYHPHPGPGNIINHSQSNSHISGMTSTMQEELHHDDIDKRILDRKENVTSGESSVFAAEFRPDENVLSQDNIPVLVSDSSFADDNKVSLEENIGNFSLGLISGQEKDNSSTSNQSVYEVGISNLSVSVDLNKDQNMVGLSANKLRGITLSVGQDCTRTLSSEVYRTEDVLQSDIDPDSKSVKAVSDNTDQSMENNATSPQELQLPAAFDESQDDSPVVGSDPVACEKITYDPSSWTPMEIKTASGNAECTLLEHPLKLRSTYTDIEDCSGTRDSNREPLVTSYNRKFMGTVDYIWCSEALQTVKVLDTIPKHALQWTPGYPTRKWGSDHIALAAQLAFAKDRSRP
ncbi:Carbon catabolite repressor protein 4-like protein [Thalictrum thalictroides]|uniref:Carbon catabolite repressor protein 4-like protein n=1 Tax=Thalictrum thalictroides TaxID=46969 RepID=A0A7J6VTL4_THATH|nr:Carbon catabolite repressor protein 4-like protein [Thalictrum thalictroides]